uniref:30S ribosomal protein S31, mitochondrial n=1 Tax=Salix viminalis TaxID=40686 RepID=A0A6N2LEW2_SALVM
MATVMQWCSAVARRAMVGQRSAVFSTSSVSIGAEMAPILCGRGDKKTKRGKRFKGTYGNARPKKEKKIERIKDKVEVPRIRSNYHQIRTRYLESRALLNKILDAICFANFMNSSFLLQSV